MYLIDPNGNYPRFRGDLKIAVPSWRDGDALPNGWVEVQDSLPPQTEPDEVYEEGPPAEVDGVLTRTWNVRPLTTEEIERRSAPSAARQRLADLGLTETEIEALVEGLI